MRISSRCLFYFPHNTVFHSSFRLFFIIFIIICIFFCSLLTLRFHHHRAATSLNRKISSQKDSINYLTPSGVEHILWVCVLLLLSYKHVLLTRRPPYSTPHSCQWGTVDHHFFYIRITKKSTFLLFYLKKISIPMSFIRSDVGLPGPIVYIKSHNILYE